MKRKWMVGVMLGLLIVVWWLAARPAGELRDFEEEFGITLPEKAKLCVSEGRYSSSQDGDRTGSLLRVYQLSSEEQLAQTQRQAREHDWQELPLADASVQRIFENKLSDYAETIPWTLEKGLYKVKPTNMAGYNRVYGDESIYGYLLERDRAGDITSLALGIIDPVSGKVYLLKFDS